MKCPFRKITTFQYDYSSLGNGSHNIKRTEEEFGGCYGYSCPFYYKDDEDNDCCDRCGSYGEGGDI